MPFEFWIYRRHHRLAVWEISARDIAEPRREAWTRLLRDLPMDKLDRMTEVVPLAKLPALAGEILNGAVRGRVVVDVNA